MTSADLGIICGAQRTGAVGIKTALPALFRIDFHPLFCFLTRIKGHNLTDSIEVLWTSEDLPRDEAHSTPTRAYRIIRNDGDSWWARARRVSVMTLQRKVFDHSFGERWQQVGVRINYLRFRHERPVAEIPSTPSIARRQQSLTSRAGRQRRNPETGKAELMNIEVRLMDEGRKTFRWCVCPPALSCILRDLRHLFEKKFASPGTAGGGILSLASICFKTGH